MALTTTFIGDYTKMSCILFRDNPSLYQNFHKTSVIGVDINMIKKTKSGTSLFGAELISNNIISNNLGNELDIPILINGDNYYTKSDSRIVTNFIENNLSITFEYFNRHNA